MANPKITSLWTLIEMMQAKLEKFGLDEEVVDAAVLIGLESLFLGDDRKLVASRRSEPGQLLAAYPAIAKA